MKRFVFTYNSAFTFLKQQGNHKNFSNGILSFQTSNPSRYELYKVIFGFIYKWGSLERKYKRGWNTIEVWKLSSKWYKLLDKLILSADKWMHTSHRYIVDNFPYDESILDLSYDELDDLVSRTYISGLLTS